jgi:hypothetical protein
MLTIHQKEHIRRIDQRLYEAVGQIEDAINALGKQLGTSPHGTFPTPKPIANISVTAANGQANIQIIDPEQASNPSAKVISYFVECATDPQFDNIVHSEHFGPFRNKNIFLGGQTVYFRAYSQFHGSAPSKIVYFGGSNPIAVACGGAAPPTQQAYQGSGGSSGGGAGYGGHQRINTQ